MIYLFERLTFDKLFRISEPKRVYRSFTVRGPPLEIDSYQDVVYYIFNFKANPSTTGLRHHGYVKFFKPKNKNPKNVPLQHLECLVDCTCPDFRYRWAWANKQRDSSVVGPQSLNQAWNKAPKITNPHGKPGLCKHILAARQFIYGLLTSFPGGEPDNASKLDRLTKYATKRWTDFEGQMQAAKAKEAEIRRRRELRNLGIRPDQPEPGPVPGPEIRPDDEEPSIDAPARMPAGKKPKATTALKKLKPEPLPLALPPGKRGREMPGAASSTPVTPPGQRGRGTPVAPPTPALAIPPGQRGRAMPGGEKRAIGNRIVRPPKKEESGWIRPEDAALCLPVRDLILESVVNTNGESMNILEAIKLVEEMETDELSHLGSGAPPPTDMGVGSDIGGETLEPSEPPMSDSAIGADTEGESALSLLRSIKISLEQIAAAVAPVEELPPGVDGGMGGGGGMGGEMGDMGAGPPGAEGEDGMPMPDEPPSDIEGEGEGEGGGGRGGDYEDEGGEGEGEAEAEAEAGEEEEAKRFSKKGKRDE